MMEQQHSGSGDNVAGDKHEHYYNTHKISKQLTTKLGKDTIIGREKELKEIDKLLNSSNSLLLINGIGGIGKSTIASYYLHSKKDKFDYYGFFEGIDDFINKLEIAFKLKIEQGKKRLDVILHELIKLEGEKLLIIDDVKDIEENQKNIDQILELKNSGYKILLTSREEVENIEQYYLDVLSNEDAKKLFNSIHKVKDEALLEEILSYLDYHAFFIEKTAHSIKKTLTPQMIRDKFKNGEFSQINVKRKQNFNKFLNQLFKLDRLDNEEILMLKQISVLPSIEIEFKFLQEIFNKKDDENFEEILNYFCEKGWLSSLNNGYKLHQIVKEFFLSNTPPILEEIQTIIDFFFNKMESAYTLEEHLHGHKYLSYLESFVSISNIIDDKQIAYFIHSAGYLNFLLGNYKRAERCYKISFKMRKEILDENDIIFAISLNGQATMKEQSGNYSKALELYLKSLSIREKYFGIYPAKVAVEYNNVGRMYDKLKKYDESYFYLSESLQLRKEIFGEKNEFTARAYNVLGSFLQDKSKRVLNQEEFDEIYQKAYEYSYKALEIRIEILSKNHPDIAISFINVGTFHAEMNEYTNAIHFFEVSLNIYQEAIGDYSTHIAKVYSNIGNVLWMQEKFEEAIKIKEKSFDLCSNVLNENHPNIIDIKKEIEMMKEKLKV